MSATNTLSLDGRPVEFRDGDTVMDAALRAGIYIPHLCHNPEFEPHGSCRVCMVTVNGRQVSACTWPAAPDLEVESATDHLQQQRRSLVQMLFVEGNHVCPGCEKSGACQLQAVAYYTGMLEPHFTHLFPRRTIDASHPDIAIDFDRCILCELCVRASRDVDKKNVFAVSGRGIHARLVINSPDGKLGQTDFAASDKAAHVCPVGAILHKRTAFRVPVGERLYDREPVSVVGDVAAHDEDDHG